MEYLLAAVAILSVAAFVAVPLRRSGSEQPAAIAAAADLEDLEARKLAKYREIRDTELDHAQGKIDEQDFRRQDAELRAEAVEILSALDDQKSTKPSS